MAYSPTARSARRCAHTYGPGHAREGDRCRAFAVWGSPGSTEGRGLCSAHAGRTRGRDRRPQGLPGYECRTVPLCRCRAYAWPHRPGGGLCLWPDPPRWRRTTPAGTKGDLRRPAWYVTVPPTVRRVVSVPLPASTP